MAKRKDKRFVKEAGIIVCHCECMYNRNCPVPVDGPCAVKRAKRDEKAIRSVRILID